MSKQRQGESENLIDTVVREYGLAPVLDVLHLGEGIHTQYCLKISCADQNYVLRPFRDTPESQIALSMNFFGWSQRNDFALTPELMRTMDGASFVEHDGGRWWLCSFIRADPALSWRQPLISHSKCYSAGQGLSLLHTALEKFRNQAVISGSQIEAADLHLETRFASFLADSQFAGHRERLSRCIEQSRKNNDTLVLVHGDYHPGNILFRDDTLVGVIDFEYLHFEKVIYEIAYAAVMFCAKWSSTITDGQIDCELLQAFLLGYKTEIHSDYLVPNMVVAAYVCACWLAQQKHFGSELNHFLNAAEQIMGGMDQITKAARGIHGKSPLNLESTGSC